MQITLFAKLAFSILALLRVIIVSSQEFLLILQESIFASSLKKPIEIK